MNCSCVFNGSSRNPYNTRDRQDKSVLIISGTRRPELFLKSDVAFPESVKCLSIYLCDEWGELGTNDSFSEEEKDTDLYDDFDEHYTRELCKGIINFHNLEHFKAHELRLTDELWCEFAKNSKKLKEIYLSNKSYNFDEFELKVCMSYMDIPFFPKGPSNIKEIYIETIILQYELYSTKEEKAINKANFISSYSENLYTHTNLKKLHIERFSWFFDSHEPLLNVAKNCIDLEEVELGRRHGSGPGRYYITISTEVMETLLQLPKIKKLSLFDILNTKLVDNEDLIFKSIEYIEIRCEDNRNYERTLDNETVISLSRQCPNLKSCIMNGEELLRI